MVQTGTNDPHQLTTHIDRRGVKPLIVALVPLLHASFHLSCVVGSQRQTLETMTSSHGTRRDEVVKGKPIEGSECIPRTLDSLINCLGRWIAPVRIIMGSPSILDVVLHLELLEALGASIVNVLGIGDELRRRSVGADISCGGWVDGVRRNG